MEASDKQKESVVAAELGIEAGKNLLAEISRAGLTNEMAAARIALAAMNTALDVRDGYC